MNRPKYGSLAALDESEIRNERPEKFARCGCGETFELSDGCSHCNGTDEHELGVEW